MVYHGDCLYLPQILAQNGHDKLFQLLFTSTPYPGLRGFELSVSEYEAWWIERLLALRPLLTATAVICQVINYPRRADGRFDARLLCLPQRVAEAVQLHPINVYIWDKLNAPPSANSRAAYDRDEWELIACYGLSQDYFFQPVRRPYKPKSKRADGRAKRRRLPDVAGGNLGGHERLHPKGALQSNVIRISASGCQGRPRVVGGSFPLALARRFILQFSRPGDWVLDPLCGAGTTLVEAQRHGRPAVGCDVEEAAVETARQWLATEAEAGSHQQAALPL